MKAWQRIEPTTVTKVGWRTITTKTFRMPNGNGSTSTFDTIHPDGQEFAGVLGLTPDNEVIITRQYRVGPEKIMDELPGGFVDEGETPEQAAVREFEEETGYQAGRIEYLGAYHKDTYMNSRWHAFIAYDCQKVTDQTLELDEYIELDTISIEQLIQNAVTDNLTDHAVVLMAYEKLRAIQKGEEDETTN